MDERNNKDKECEKHRAGIPTVATELDVVLSFSDKSEEYDSTSDNSSSDIRREKKKKKKKAAEDDKKRTKRKMEKVDKKARKAQTGGDECEKQRAGTPVVVTQYDVLFLCSDESKYDSTTDNSASSEDIRHDRKKAEDDKQKKAKDDKTKKAEIGKKKKASKDDTKKKAEVD